MARTLDAVLDSFSSAICKPLDLSSATELVRISAPVGSPGRKAFNATKIESIYELAYLQVFGLWERFLEDAFYRLLCGYATGGYAVTLKPTISRAATLAAAELQVLNGKQYHLWHNPTHVIGRSQKFFVAAPHETVVSSALNQITQLAAIRHHIAHSTPDTLKKYHSATMSLAGARFGRRAGRFLRTHTLHPVSGVQIRWLHLLTEDLISLSQQFK